MTLPLIDAASAAENSVFRQKAIAAAVRYAGVIADELLAQEELTALERSRLLLAQAVIADPPAHNTRVAYVLACHADIEAGDTDAEFVDAVEANWDLFATLPL